VLLKVTPRVGTVALSRELLLPITLAWFLFAIAFVAGRGLGARLGWSRQTTGAMILAVGLGNTLFVGYPLIEWRLGPEALPIAVLGLIVNLGCAVLLGVGHDDHAPAGHHHHDHDHDHDHGVGDDHHDRAAQHHAGDHALGHHHAADAGEAPAHPGGHDHNLRSAYLHVIADAFTSVLAIVALLAGRYLHWTVLDPLMGIVGAVVISRWAFDLARGSARQLLDAAIEPLRTERLRSALEAEGTSRVLDLHLWEIGPNRRACVVAVAEHEPREPDHYRARVRAVEDVCHLTVEVHHVRAARDDE